MTAVNKRRMNALRKKLSEVRARDMLAATERHRTVLEAAEDLVGAWRRTGRDSGDADILLSALLMEIRGWTKTLRGTRTEALMEGRDLGAMRVRAEHESRIQNMERLHDHGRVRLRARGVSLVVTDLSGDNEIGSARVSALLMREYPGILNEIAQSTWDMADREIEGQTDVDPVRGEGETDGAA